MSTLTPPETEFRRLARRLIRSDGVIRLAGIFDLVALTAVIGDELSLLSVLVRTVMLACAAVSLHQLAAARRMRRLPIPTARIAVAVAARHRRHSLRALTSAALAVALLPLL